MNPIRFKPIPLPAKQNGVVLIVAIIVLVAMTLAGIAMVRSIDIATEVAGNLAFRQQSTLGADGGTEVARKWLMAQGGVLLRNDVPPGYFSTWSGGAGGVTNIFDPTTFDWEKKSNSLPQDGAGNVVRYVIHRMCQSPGDPGDATINCLMAPSTSSGQSQRILTGNEISCPNCVASNNPYYRITIKTEGPRNTVSYVQATLY